jgi:phosphohistidine phosphatase
MKRLYLIRHAKSSWNNPDLADSERPLNKRGKRDAPFMGKCLKKYEAHPDLIMSSPAKRALKTANIIAKEIGFPKGKIVSNESMYMGSVATLFEVIRNIDESYNHVMLFGHNPDLTNLAEYLTNYPVDNIPTCGIFCMDFDIDSWKDISEGKGTLVFFDYPKKHA